MKKILYTATIIIIALNACKKSTTEEPTPAPTPTAVGLWKGYVTIASNPIALNLKADNTLNVYNTVDTAAATASGKGTGTWQKMNNIINVTYKYNQQNNSTTAALTANDAFTNMSGDAFTLGTLFGKIVVNK
jgi:hypothetical protein